jgi:hypothetical protein
MCGNVHCVSVAASSSGSAGGGFVAAAGHRVYGVRTGRQDVYSGYLPRLYSRYLTLDSRRSIVLDVLYVTQWEEVRLHYRQCNRNGTVSGDQGFHKELAEI